MFIKSKFGISKKLFDIIWPYAATITMSGERFFKIFNSSSLLKLIGFLKSILLFLQNISTGEGLIFCPLLDFFGGCV